MTAAAARSRTHKSRKREGLPLQRKQHWLKSPGVLLPLKQVSMVLVRHLHWLTLLGCNSSKGGVLDLEHTGQHLLHRLVGG